MISKISRVFDIHKGTSNSGKGFESVSNIVFLQDSSKLVDGPLYEGHKNIAKLIIRMILILRYFTCILKIHNPLMILVSTVVENVDEVCNDPRRYDNR